MFAVVSGLLLVAAVGAVSFLMPSHVFEMFDGDTHNQGSFPLSNEPQTGMAIVKFAMRQFEWALNNHNLDLAMQFFNKDVRVVGCEYRYGGYDSLKKNIAELDKITKNMRIEVLKAKMQKDKKVLFDIQMVYTLMDDSTASESGTYAASYKWWYPFIDPPGFKIEYIGAGQCDVSGASGAWETRH